MNLAGLTEKSTSCNAAALPYVLLIHASLSDTVPYTLRPDLLLSQQLTQLVVIFGREASALSFVIKATRCRDHAGNFLPVNQARHNFHCDFPVQYREAVHRTRQFAAFNRGTQASEIPSVPNTATCPALFSERTASTTPSAMVSLLRKTNRIGMLLQSC